jgi:hypothetical protein
MTMRLILPVVAVIFAQAAASQTFNIRSEGKKMLGDDSRKKNDGMMMISAEDNNKIVTGKLRYK